MTVAEIDNELAQQTAIHTAAKQIVELIEATARQVARLGGDDEAARDRIIELVTEG